MKRTPIPRRSRQTPDVAELTRLAQSLSLSSSRVEDNFWEQRLARLIDQLIDSGNDEALNAAMDQLYRGEGRAYDALADMIEACCENRGAGARDDNELLLFAAPLLAWSRFVVPAVTIPAAVLDNLRVQLQAHVLAAEVRVGLADILFSPDQLPHGYCETARLADRLGKAALHARDLRVDPSQLGETVNFLSDTRYLVGVAVAPKGAPLFRWQEADGNREESLLRWRTQGGEALRPLLPACAYELLQPLAYHAACRDADRLSRPYSIRASVAFLNTALNIASPQLRAVAAPFCDRKPEEYRIGFALKENGAVVHGVVWPLLEAEDENSDTPAQIEAVLRESGIEDVRLLDHQFPLEYCDDCGAPFYPNAEGEPVHAELPEDDGAAMPQHLH